MGTVPGFGVGKRPVRLPVSGQVTGRAVTFPAIRTLAFLVGRFLRSLLLQQYLLVAVIVVVVTVSIVGFFLHNTARQHKKKQIV